MDLNTVTNKQSDDHHDTKPTTAEDSLLLKPMGVSIQLSLSSQHLNSSFIIEEPNNIQEVSSANNNVSIIGYSSKPQTKTLASQLSVPRSPNEVMEQNSANIEESNESSVPIKRYSFLSRDELKQKSMELERTPSISHQKSISNTESTCLKEIAEKEEATNPVRETHNEDANQNRTSKNTRENKISETTTISKRIKPPEKKNPNKNISSRGMLNKEKSFSDADLTTLRKWRHVETLNDTFHDQTVRMNEQIDTQMSSANSSFRSSNTQGSAHRFDSLP